MPGALVLNTALLGLNLHMVPLLIDRGLTPQTAATVLSAQVFGSTCIYLVAGYLLDKVSTPKLALFFSLCALGGLVMIHFGSGLSTLLIAGTLIGAGTTGEGSVIPVLPHPLFWPQGFRLDLRADVGCRRGANGIQPVILGRIFDTQGSYGWGLLYCEVCVSLSRSVFSPCRVIVMPPNTAGRAGTVAEGIGEAQSMGA